VEALIVTIAALAVLVWIDAGYWVAISLVRWSPVIATGAVAGWLAHHHGADNLQALGIGFIASIVARHVMRPRFIYDDNDFP
jgi:hypothetical protein